MSRSLVRKVAEARARGVVNAQSCQKRFKSISATDPFEEGDIVLMRPITGNQTFMSPPLKAGESLNTHKGIVQYSDIIGKKPRDTIVSTTGQPSKFMLHHPSLEDYITRVKRVVTPIYPHDAACIVNHLDIHVDPILEGEDPTPVEILESGTGHGSLTLALCRAIHAANPPGFPQGAILHSVDISSRHSKVAQKVVGGFRRGMYERDVQFYVNNPGTWIEEEFKRRGSEEPFLAAAVLDLPDAQKYLHLVSKALKMDAPLGVFCPSITQIGACVRTIREDKDTRLVLERTVEFIGGEVGGRDWDVRLAKLRAPTKPVQKQTPPPSSVVEDVEAVGPADTEEVIAELPATEEIPAVEEKAEDRWEMVCRPLVGKVTFGGGFYSIFKKKEPYVSGGLSKQNQDAKAEETE